MEKTIFKLTMDEDEKFVIDSDYDPTIIENVSEAEQSDILDRTIDRLAESIFKTGLVRDDIGKILRMIAIAMIMADPQPYENIENLWSTMMFSTLPKREKRLRKMKEKAGVKVDVVEPITSNGYSVFPLGKVS